MALLSVEHLVVVYRGDGAPVRAVDGISFTIEPGQVVALVGESGCGKTSAALALTRLLPAPPAEVSGRVLFEQTNLLEAPEESLRAIRGGKISYVFQDPASSLNPVLTVGEQIMEAVELHTGKRGKEARRVAVEWLDRVGIVPPPAAGPTARSAEQAGRGSSIRTASGGIASAEERLGAYPHEFSGGMQQRVMLAMALAARPSLLVADEPTTALDVTVQVQILRLLRDLQRSLDLSVLLISHDLTVVERIAHRIGVMAAGKLVELGDVEQVLRHPAHPYTQALLRYRSMVSLRRGP